MRFIRAFLSQAKEHLQLVVDLTMLNAVHLLLFSSIQQFSALELVLLGNFAWIAIYVMLPSQRQGRNWNYGRHIIESLRFVCIQFMIVYALNVVLFDGKFTNSLAVFCAYLFIANAVGRLSLIWFLRKIRSRGYNYKRVIVVGDESLIESFTREIADKVYLGYKLLGTFSENLELTSQNPSGQSIDIYDFLVDHSIDEVVVSIHVSKEKVQSLLTYCQLNGIVINITHDLLNGIRLERMDTSTRVAGQASLLTVKEDWLQAMMRTDVKRLFDVVFSLLFITAIGSWLFPLIALLIKLTSDGPVFFVQERSGLNNRGFDCYKFRTMRVNNERDTRQATANDERVTRFGRFLRASNLDELPQFFNVLLGDMSIVGPRPHMLKHTEEYGQLVDHYNERLWIKPGITGLAQSKGFRGEIRELGQLINRIYHDRYYVRNWSFLLDIKIILFTAWNMISLQRMGA